MMDAKNQSTEEFNNAKMIVQAHMAFKKAETVKELFTAAVRAKAAGDASLIKRFEEIMRLGLPENHPQSISFENISDKELKDYFEFFEKPCSQFTFK